MPYLHCTNCGEPVSYQRRIPTNLKEGDICGVCGALVCEDCIDHAAGAGQEPFPEQEIVCISFIKYFENNANKALNR